ncbi:MAG TPA: hypothetical protein DCZ40_00315 [Lachnospiraceae bacterium]|nr:hypothetical protein [Lachnospiraceae bacterium]
MISVIVPIFNNAEYLPRCIESICGQTYRDLEILLIDDGSTDGCYEICNEYKKNDSRIVVIHRQNGGAVSARKTGMAYAKGEYIAFADGDDWMEPDMLECLFSALIREKTDIAMCGRFEDTGGSHKEVYQGIPAGRYDKKALIEEVYPNMIVNGAFFEWGLFPGLWDKLFRRECLEKFLLAVDERITMGDDAACTYPCMLNADSVYILDKCLYHYRQSRASTVKQKPDVRMERQRYRILYRTVSELFKKYRTVYDLTEQWKEYMLFLMVPRADALLEGVEGLDYLFPFPKVKKGSRIIIYGMGTYGQRLYKYIEQTGICTITALADRNYAELKKQGLSVEAPDKIAGYKFDAIVIASSFAKARSAIYRELAEKYGYERVHAMDEKLVKSKTVMEAFGLI